MSATIRSLLAVAPLLLTLLFGWLMMEGHLNFGSGEKDVFLVLPLLLWSLVYLCSCLVMCVRRSPLVRSLVLSASVATGGVVVAWLLLLGLVLLGAR